MRINIGFLASHHGSNMQAIIAACKSGVLDAKPVVVISNNGKSRALLIAKQEGIPCYHLSAKTHPVPEELDSAILNTLVTNQVNLVVLAGYDRKLDVQTLKHYQCRVINIHPALLPKYGGTGMYGIYVHQAVLAAGEKETGVSIHLVDKDYDRGPVIAQTRVSICQMIRRKHFRTGYWKGNTAFWSRPSVKLSPGKLVCLRGIKSKYKQVCIR